jgi:hypothetical protein
VKSLLDHPQLIVECFGALLMGVGLIAWGWVIRQ